jgi:phage FluMu protein Com
VPELVRKCLRCNGTAREISGDGLRERTCPSCNELGCFLDEEIGSFVLALLADEHVYKAVLDFVKKLKSDLSRA